MLCPNKVIGRGLSVQTKETLSEIVNKSPP